jgi:hypothetical protein
MYYKIRIDETGRNSPKDQAQRFNVIEECVNSLEDVKIFLINQYGKIPGKKNKIYIDDKNGKSKEVGFLHSFWNKDCSHNSKKWFQTDWITITEIHESPVLIN